jgi:hypothetical protein
MYYLPMQAQLISLIARAYSIETLYAGVEEGKAHRLML